MRRHLLSGKSSFSPTGFLTGSTNRNPMQNNAPRTASRPTSTAMKNSITSDDPTRPIFSDDSFPSLDLLSRCVNCSVKTYYWRTHTAKLLTPRNSLGRLASCGTSHWRIKKIDARAIVKLRKCWSYHHFVVRYRSHWSSSPAPEGRSMIVSRQ